MPAPIRRRAPRTSRRHARKSSGRSDKSPSPSRLRRRRKPRTSPNRRCRPNGRRCRDASRPAADRGPRPRPSADAAAIRHKARARPGIHRRLAPAPPSRHRERRLRHRRAPRVKRRSGRRRPSGATFLRSTLFVVSCPRAKRYPAIRGARLGSESIDMQANATAGTSAIAPDDAAIGPEFRRRPPRCRRREFARPDSTRAPSPAARRPRAPRSRRRRRSAP